MSVRSRFATQGIAAFAVPIAALAAACQKAPREADPSVRPSSSPPASPAPSSSPPAAAAPEPMPSLEALCARFASIPVPAADLPGKAESSALSGCDAEASYYGIGVPVDYVRARHCALRKKLPATDAYADPEVLAMVYANGRGVPVNAELAIRFACQAGAAPAELAGQLMRLWAIRAGTPPPTAFDPCDDATSGALTGHCEELRSRIASSVQKAALQTFAAGLPERELAAVRKAADDFFTVRSTNETDQSGTQRASIAIAERSRLQDEYVRSIAQLKDAAFTPAPGDGREADAEMQALLLRIRSCASLAEPPLPGLPASAGIEKTQARFLAYRSAWVALGTKQRPGTSAGAWRAWITRPRIEQLKELADGC